MRHHSLSSLRHLEFGGEDTWWADYDLVWNGCADDMQHMTNLTTLRVRMAMSYTSSGVSLPHLPHLTTLSLTRLNLNSAAAATVANYSAAPRSRTPAARA